MSFSVNVRESIDVLNDYSRLKPLHQVFLSYCGQCRNISVIDLSCQKSSVSELITFFDLVYQEALHSKNAYDLSLLSHAIIDYTHISHNEITARQFSALKALIRRTSIAVMPIVLQGRTLANVLNYLTFEESSKLQIVSSTFQKVYTKMIKSFFHHLVGPENDLFTNYQQLKSIDFSRLSSSCTDSYVGIVSSLPGLTNLNLSRCHQITDKTFMHLSKATHLKDLDISRCLLINGVGLSNLASLKGLKRLSLYMCKNFYHTSMKEFFNFTTLTELNLGGCHRIAGDDLKYLIKSKQLTYLNLYHCNRLQDTSLNYLVGKTALTFLDISECKFTSGGVFTLYGLNIRYLNLSELDHLDNQFIQNAIQGFRQLNTLVLSHTSDINDEAFFHIASSSELRRLQFKNLPRITNHGFDQLCQLPMLGELDIEYLPAVSLNGINVLSKLKTVFSLSIKDQKITDNGLQEMSKMEGLSYLQLNNTRGYTAAGFYHLTRLRNLKVLEITGSPLDFECIEAISKMASLNSLSISVQEPQRLELAFMRLKQIRTNLRASLATSFSGFSMEE